MQEKYNIFLGGFVMVQQDRSFVKWLLLSIVTCGIYSFVFMYQWIKDINTICDGDGIKKNSKEA